METAYETLWKIANKTLAERFDDILSAELKNRLAFTTLEKRIGMFPKSITLVHRSISLRGVRESPAATLPLSFLPYEEDYLLVMPTRGGSRSYLDILSWWERDLAYTQVWQQQNTNCDACEDDDSRGIQRDSWDHHCKDIIHEYCPPSKFKDPPVVVLGRAGRAVEMNSIAGCKPKASTSSGPEDQFYIAIKLENEERSKLEYDLNQPDSIRCNSKIIAIIESALKTKDEECKKAVK
ncbi:hypothetical protein HY837_05060 [archaeon]|nr:hypothetical protein [archaeon]